MELLDFHANKIKACFQFIHKGHIVSCSSIMNVNRVDVIFWDTKDELNCNPANNVQDAIIKIDKKIEALKNEK